MPSFGVAVAWIILSPPAFVTNVVIVLVILHYRPYYHSCDVAFLSLLLTMATNSFLLFPIPAVVTIEGISWTRSLCRCYTLLSITLRSSHLLVLLILNVYWMATIRVSQKRQIICSSKFMKASVCVCWFLSFVAGLIPAADDDGRIFGNYEENCCKFLPENVGVGYSIFFIIISLVSAVLGTVSSLDSFLLFRSMKEVALTKYSAGRFHVPTVSRSVQDMGQVCGRQNTGQLSGRQNTGQVYARYSELNVSLDLCRLVLAFSVLSALVNALPLLVSQFVQLVQDYDRDSLETALLWLLLIESLILPHLLWLMSARYRHAAAYTWRVHVRRDVRILEDDTSSCAFQSYRLKGKAFSSHTHINGGITRYINGTAHRLTDADDNLDATNFMFERALSESRRTPEGRQHSTTNHHNGGGRGRHRDTIDVSSDVVVELSTLTRLPTSGIISLQEDSQLETKHNNINEQIYSGRAVKNSTNSTSEIIGKNQLVKGQLEKAAVSSVTSTDDSENSSQETTRHSITEVKRSVSLTSRQEWKERMRKKHLPTIFLSMSMEEEAEVPVQKIPADQSKKLPAEADVSELQNDVALSARRQAIMSNVASNWTSTESTYYMSGEYHYDYIRDTFSNGHQHVRRDSLKDNVYNDDDIISVLDESLPEPSKRRGSNLHKLDSEVVENSHDGLCFNNQNLSQSVIASDLSYNAIFDSSDSTNKRDTDLSSSSAVKILGSTQERINYSDKIRAENKNESNLSLSHNYGINSENLNIVTKNNLDPKRNSTDADEKKESFVRALDEVAERAGIGQDIMADESISEINSENASVDVWISRDNSPPRNDLTPKHGPQPQDDLLTHADLTPPDYPQPQDKLTRHDDSEHVAKTKVLDKRNDPAPRDSRQEDYTKLENVSGEEMLLIKMKSVRSATAFYPNDDSSDDEGVDNYGFEDDISHDNDDQQSFMKTTSSRLLQSKLDTSSTISEQSRKSTDLYLGHEINQVSTNFRGKSSNFDGENSRDHRPRSDGEEGTDSSTVRKSALSIAKPPRHRKNIGDTSLQRSHSLGDKYDCTLDNKLGGPCSIYPTSDSPTGGINGPDIPEREALNKSSNDNISVTIQPYGRRISAWMDYSSNYSSFEFDSFTQNHVNYPLEEGIIQTNRDSIHKNNHSWENDFRRLHELSFNSKQQFVDQSLSFPQGQYSLGLHPMDHHTPGQGELDQNSSNEDEDDDFNESPVQEYISHPSFYRNMNICFESILEVPEESLTDTASTCESSCSSGSTQAGQMDLQSRRAVTDQTYPASRAAVRDQTFPETREAITGQTHLDPCGDVTGHTYPGSRGAVTDQACSESRGVMTDQTYSGSSSSIIDQRYLRTHGVIIDQTYPEPRGDVTDHTYPESHSSVIENSPLDPTPRHHQTRTQTQDSKLRPVFSSLERTSADGSEETSLTQADSRDQPNNQQSQKTSNISSNFDFRNLNKMSTSENTEMSAIDFCNQPKSKDLNISPALNTQQQHNAHFNSSLETVTKPQQPPKNSPDLGKPSKLEHHSRNSPDFTAPSTVQHYPRNCPDLATVPKLQHLSTNNSPDLTKPSKLQHHTRNSPDLKTIPAMYQDHSVTKMETTCIDDLNPSTESLIPRDIAPDTAGVLNSTTGKTRHVKAVDYGSVYF